VSDMNPLYAVYCVDYLSRKRTRESFTDNDSLRISHMVWIIFCITGVEKCIGHNTLGHLQQYGLFIKYIRFHPFACVRITRAQELSRSEGPLSLFRGQSTWISLTIFRSNRGSTMDRRTTAARLLRRPATMSLKR
jgi:hypothetical protein